MTPTKLFEPDATNDLLRGWLLHAHKGRDRHDLAARRCDQRRFLVGVPTVVASAIVGTSTFAALQGSPARELQIAVGAAAILAAILAALQTFLDLGARAERHRVAAVRYKSVIRHMEQLGIGTIESGLDAPEVTELRRRLDALEDEAPVVPVSIYKAVEEKYRDVAFVDSLGGPSPRTP